MFFPIRTDSPLRTTPYMNWAIIAVNLLMFAGQTIAGAGDGRVPTWWQPLMLWSGYPELYQFVTYGFLHSGFLHILFNLLFLYIFGNNVNDKMGHVGYLAFYLASVIFSGVAFVWMNDGSPVLGASGAVSAVTGAYMILFPRAHVTVLMFFILIGTFEIPSIYFVLFYFVKDLIGLGGTGDNVAYIAHVGGTLFGISVSMLLLWGNLLPRDQFDVLALVRQWNRRRAYRDAVSKGWNPYGGTVGRSAGQQGPVGWFQPDPVTPAAQPIDPRQEKLLTLRAEISEAIANHNLRRASDLYVELKSHDPKQVLSRQAQIDVANQLQADQRYAQAIEAYETFLLHYPKYEQIDQVELMAGVILSRFLNRPEKAREHLLRAMAKLTDERGRAMAADELKKIGGADVKV